MIPGLKTIPAFMAGAGGGISLTFLASAVSSSGSITIPAAAQAGDWAILFDAAGDTGTVPTAVPSGWTSLANTAASVVRMITSYRKLTGGGSVTGMSGAVQQRKIMLVFRPSTSIVTNVASTWNAEVTTGEPTLQTVSASGVAAPLIVFAFAAADISSAPVFTTETPSMTNLTRTGSNFSTRVGYTIYNSSPSNQSIDIADAAGIQGLQSGYVRFT